MEPRSTHELDELILVNGYWLMVIGYWLLVIGY